MGARAQLDQVNWMVHKRFESFPETFVKQLVSSQVAPHSPCRHFVSSSKDGDVRIWDVTSRKSVICLSGQTRAVICVKWGGDGTFIYILNYNYFVCYSCVFSLR